MRGPVFFELEGGGPVPKGAFIALAPGADVSCHKIEMPPRVPLQARKAIAQRQLEARFGLEETELFPLTGAAQKEPWSRVLAVSSSTASEWRTRLAPFSAQCRGLIPDYLALPVRSGVGTLWIIASKTKDASPEIIARLTETSGFRAEWDLAITVLSLSKNVPETLEVHGALDEDQRAELDSLTPKISMHSTETPQFNKTPVTHGALSTDLLENDAARLSQMHQSVRRWSLPVALTACALAAWCTSIWNETQTNQHRLAEYNTLSTQLVRQYFIPNGPLLDLRKQVEQVTSGTRGQVQNADTSRPSDPMPLMQIMAASLAQYSAKVGQIAYSAPADTTQTPALSVNLHLPSFADLDALLETMRARALAVSVTQSSADPEGGVQSQLQVSKL